MAFISHVNCASCTRSKTVSTSRSAYTALNSSIAIGWVRQMSSRQAENSPFDHLDEPDDDELHSPSPWQSLLQPAARAVWRSSPDGPPQYLAHEHFTVLQETHRSSKQLRNTHKRTIKSHLALAERRERDRRRSVNYKVPYDSLAHKNALNRDSQTTPVYYGPEQTLANLKHRLLPNYAIVKRVLTECQSLLGSESFQPRRLIDFGVGCGGAAAAALDIFDGIEWIHGIDPSQSMRDGASRVLQAASGEKSAPPRVTLSESLSTESSSSGFDLALCAYTAVELPHTASTLTAAAVLWEKLRPNGLLVMIEPGTPDGFNSVRAVRKMLLECCPPDAIEEEQCHVIAPCTHSGKCPMERHIQNFKKLKASSVTEIERNDNKEFHRIDNSELEDLEPVDTALDEDEDGENFWTEIDDDSDWNEAAADLLTDSKKHNPDSSTAETHAFDTAYCSFVHTFPGGSRRSTGEKFSYLVVQKRVADDQDMSVPNSSPFQSSKVAALLTQTYEAASKNAKDKKLHSSLLDEARHLTDLYEQSEIDPLCLEPLRGDENRKSFGRIVRAPLKKRGHVMVDFCSSDHESGEGRIIRHRVSKGMSSRVAPGMYSAARKARWGGFWPDLEGRIYKNESESSGDPGKDRQTTE